MSDSQFAGLPNLNTEQTLTYKEHRAVVSPFGASLRGYSLMIDDREWKAVWGYHGGANKKGGQGDVLIPFPGRIKGATYSLEGRTYELAKTDKDGPNAIHGFLRARLFETKSVSETEAIFTTELDGVKESIPGYPFSLSIEVAYSLSEDGLQTKFKITNKGKTAAPAGAGFHPYFRGDVGALADWQITIPAKSYVELENIVPTGRILPVEKTEFDFRFGRLIGDSRYNGCVAHLERDSKGWATAIVATQGSSHTITIRMDESFDYVVIYTGDAIAAPDARQGFAIEPMTCAPDAFNRPDWGLKVLKAGESMHGTYVIKAQ